MSLLEKQLALQKFKVSTKNLNHKQKYKIQAAKQRKDIMTELGRLALAIIKNFLWRNHALSLLPKWLVRKAITNAKRSITAAFLCAFSYSSCSTSS